MQGESDICGNRKAAFDDDDERAVREKQRRPVAVGTRPSDSAGKKRRRRGPPSPAAGSPVEKPSAADGDGDGTAATTTSASRGPATSPDDPRVAEAVRLWRKAPALSVIQVMRAVCFPEEDCQSRGKQMWIRRRTPNAREMRRTAPPNAEGVRTAPPLVALRPAAAGRADGSPPPPRKKRRAPIPSEEGRTKKNAHPAAPPSAGEKKKSPAPAAPLRRATIRAAQENRVHRRSLAAYKAMVHKKATELYASERKKEDGMSARQVREHLALEYDHVPSARTIQRYFATDLVGAAPLRHGPGGNVPRDVFERLCVAFQTKIRINQLNGEESENSMKKLAAAVNACANREGSRDPRSTLLKRLLAETAEGILADTGA